MVSVLEEKKKQTKKLKKTKVTAKVGEGGSS